MARAWREMVVGKAATGVLAAHVPAGVNSPTAWERQRETLTGPSACKKKQIWEIGQEHMISSTSQSTLLHKRLTWRQVWHHKASARLLSNRYVCFCRLGRMKDTKNIKPLGKKKKIILTALHMKMKMPLRGKSPTLYYALGIWQTQAPVLAGFSSPKLAWRACRTELHQLAKQSKPLRGNAASCSQRHHPTHRHPSASPGRWAARKTFMRYVCWELFCML